MSGACRGASCVSLTRAGVLSLDGLTLKRTRLDRGMQPPNRIETEADLRAGVQVLRDRCVVFQRIVEAAGPPPMRRREQGFIGLGRIIVGQQLSVASAAAIWGRCEKGLKPFTPERISRARETTLRKAGLSAPKIRTLKALSRAVLEGELDLGRAPVTPDDDERLYSELTAVTGIGPWTADIYLMFCVGRPDAFAPGDLALQIGAQHAFELAERPQSVELEQLVDHWRPWRAVGARVLWSYYAVAKKQKNAVPV